MDETLHQLGGLLLGSVPTIFLFFLIVILYQFLVYRPLTRVLNERRERTEGAIEQAHAAIAAATDNDELCRVLKNIQDQIWLCRCKTYNLSSSTASDAHLTILKALEANDRKAAQTAMRSHIDHVRTRLIDFLEHGSLKPVVKHT